MLSQVLQDFRRRLTKGRKGNPALTFNLSVEEAAALRTLLNTKAWEDLKAPVNETINLGDGRKLVFTTWEWPEHVDKSGEESIEIKATCQVWWAE